MKQETIHIEKLSIGYPGKGDVKVVASDICAGINSGELTCLLGANGVTIGTPEDLSLDGTLSGFFARKGIVFDLETGLFRVNNEYTSHIRIVGHGQKYAMVRKALQRNGILANRNVESDVYIETGDLKGDGTFVLHSVNGEAVTVQTIGELLAEIVKIL